MTTVIDPYEEHRKPDVYGRVLMGSDSGLAMTKASMSRFVMFCLGNRVQIHGLEAFDPKFRGSLVMCMVRLRPDQFEAFTRETGGKLREPPRINLNSGPSK